MISKVQNLWAPPACKPQKLIQVSLEKKKKRNFSILIEQKQLAAELWGMKDYLFIDLPFLKVMNSVP